MITKTKKELCELLKIKNNRLNMILKRKHVGYPKNVGTKMKPIYKLNLEMFVKILDENTLIDNKNVSRETLLEKGSGFIKFLKKSIR